MNELITQQDAENIRETRLKIEAFTRIVSQKPRKVQKNKFTKLDYVPISEIETALDELFFYQWEWIDIQTKHCLNSVICSGVLRVKHPSTGEWIRRSGQGACKLQQNKGANVDDFSQLKKEAFEMAVPVADIMALKNAAKKFGKLFGRDLNREFEAEFIPLIKPENPQLLKQLKTLFDKDKNIDAVMIQARRGLNELEIADLKKHIQEAMKND